MQPQSWTAVTGNPLLSITFLTASACPASLLSTSSCGDLLGVKSRPGLDVLLLMRKSCGSVLLLLLLDHPSMGKKEMTSPSPVHLSKEFPGVVAPVCSVAVWLSVLLMVYLLLHLFSALCKSMLLK